MNLLRAFFERYEAALNDMDIDTITQSFEHNFLTGGPGFVRPTINDAQFRSMMDRSFQIYRRMDVRKIMIDSYQEIALGRYAWVVKIEWKLIHRNGGTSRGFGNTYIVQLCDDMPKITMFMTHSEE